MNFTEVTSGRSTPARAGGATTRAASRRRLAARSSKFEFFNGLLGQRPRLGRSPIAVVSGRPGWGSTHFVGPFPRPLAWAGIGLPRCGGTRPRKDRTTTTGPVPPTMTRQPRQAALVAACPLRKPAQSKACQSEWHSRHGSVESRFDKPIVSRHSSAAFAIRALVRSRFRRSSSRRLMISRQDGSRKRPIRGTVNCEQRACRNPHSRFRLRGKSAAKPFRVDLQELIAFEWKLRRDTELLESYPQQNASIEFLLR